MNLFKLNFLLLFYGIFLGTKLTAQSIILNSAAGTDNQTVCTGALITPISYLIADGATSAIVTGLPSGITGSFSSGIFTISGSSSVSTAMNIYTVTTIGGVGPPITNSGTISINPLPILVITNPAPLCAPGTIDLTATNITIGSSGGALSYWTDPTLTLSIIDPTTISDSGTYYIRSISSYGCGSSHPVHITIFSTPNLLITNPASVYFPNTIDLTNPSITIGSSNVASFSYTDEYNTPIPDPTMVSCSGINNIIASSPYGCSIGAVVIVTIIGCYNEIKENEENNISIFPNPFNDKLMISLENNQEAEIEIVDFAGRMILHQKIDEQIVTIDTSNLSEGQYMIKIKNSSSLVTHRISK